jgi:hypothetical protein
VDDRLPDRPGGRGVNPAEDGSAADHLLAGTRSPLPGVKLLPVVTH